ncbi:hypothetical protein [Roseicella aerolata]|nr:hypothetical protein [Roseicella aerolata]
MPSSLTPHQAPTRYAAPVHDGPLFYLILANLALIALAAIFV